MSFNFLLIFSVTVFVASIIPGPSMLLALTHGMNYGARRSIASAFGNLTATVIQASISFAGLGTILIASHTVFLAIKWAGAAYLVYMGISVLLAAKKTQGPVHSANFETSASLKKMYLQAVLVTAGNPKAIVFFTAVLPQFINPDIDMLFQFSVLMSIGAFIAFGCFMIYAVSGQKIVAVFSEQKAGKIIKSVIGCSFIAAGFGLAFGHR